jgi:tyrosinase
MLTTNQGYTSFSTNSLALCGDNYNPHSLEMIHDRVHVLIGGDMGFVPTAAFDPIFWLHHAMVDRAFAFRQALYPHEWVQPWSEVGDTYTYARGTIEDSTSPLMPFRSNEFCGFLDSDSVRDYPSLGYDYADLASGQSATEIINSLYRDNETRFSDASTETGSMTQGYIARSRMTQEYLARIEVNSMRTNGSFTVFLFDGEVNDDPASWDTASSLLAAHGFFSGPKSGDDGNTLVRGGVSLTSMLSKRRVDGRLRSMDNIDVTKYLQNSLKLRIRMLDGTIAFVVDVPQLKVSIVTSDVELSPSIRDLPRWSEFQVLMEIDIDDTRHTRDLK